MFKRMDLGQIIMAGYKIEIVSQGQHETWSKPMYATQAVLEKKLQLPLEIKILLKKT